MIDRQKLISAIPPDLFHIWRNIDDKVQQNILFQAEFYPDLDKSQLKMESFWVTRDLYNERYSTKKEIRKKKLEKIANKNTKKS